MNKIEVGKRVAELRKALGMTQESLGESLSMKKSALSKIESGENALTEKNQEILRQNFSVNKTWLLTGEGDTFCNEDLGVITSVLRSFKNINPKDLQILEAYLRLEEKHRAAFRELFSKMFEK